MKADELSAASGVPLGTLTKIFSGVSDSVKLGNMVSICDALGVSLDYIITGVPDNLNNFTLDGEEIRLIEDYRRLDKYGRDLVSAVIAKERERSAEGEYFHPSKSQDYSENRPGHAVILTAPAERKYRDSDARRTERRFIPLCELPVSAGPGEFLDSSSFSDRISVPHGDVTDRADFAVRISGDSMMPRYRDGDILLVESSESVEPGEPCIYVLDGCGYFKIFGGDCLLPLNKKYEKIMLRDFESVSCSGRVIGRVKKK
ncbi:MAG: helix-turn-helix domain-containing protein [Clostridia bacterium]|nr:helix-turn-helix domain-containing protein [Clostridia bacterium]